MAVQEDKGRSKRDRIERLRRRLAQIEAAGHQHPIISVIKGLLDLLDDEL